MSSAPPVTLLERIAALDGRRDLPLHAQVRVALRRVIEQHFDDGAKFFTEPQLIAHLKVSQATVRRAMLDLARDGLLDRQVAKGSFVRKPPARATGVRTVGVFLPEWDSPFLIALLEHVSAACRSLGRRMHIYHTRKGEFAQEAYRQVERPPAEEAVLLLANEPRTTVELAEGLGERGYRLVNVDTLVENLSCPFVGIDNDAVVRLGLEHLTGLGHERITLLVNEPAGQQTVVRKVEAFNRITRRMKLRGCRVFECGTKHFEDSYLAAVAKAAEVMAGADAPTAVFAVSDPGAWGMLKGLRDLGLDVPGRVSVLGFSDDRPSRYTHPALTTIAQPHEQIARRAVELLVDPSPVRTQVLLAPSLVVRDSTGRAGPGKVRK